MGVREFVANATRYATQVRDASPSRGPIAADTHRLGIPIFVINLARSEHRRRFAVGHLKSLGLEATIFPAVDGRELDLAELEGKGIYRDDVAHEKFSRSLSPAEIGCALSHLGVYEKVVRENIDRAIVLEDDAMLVEDVHARLASLMATLPPDWHLVQFMYGSQDHEPAAPGLVTFRMQKSMPVAASGYLINRAGAQLMIDNAYPIHYPADSLLGRSPRWGAKVYGIDPQIVSINNVFPSSINAPGGFKSQVSNKVKDWMVRLLG